MKAAQLHLLKLAESRGASEEVKRQLAALVGETRLCGRQDMLTLASPIPWLPLPIEFDPMLLAWFDPAQAPSSSTQEGRTHV